MSAISQVRWGKYQRVDVFYICEEQYPIVSLIIETALANAGIASYRTEVGFRYYPEARDGVN